MSHTAVPSTRPGTRPGTGPSTPDAAAPAAPMSHRAIRTALSGLLPRCSWPCCPAPSCPTCCLGGSIGVSVLGAVLSSQVAGTVTEKPSAAGVPAGGSTSSSSIPDLGSLPGPVRLISEGAFGQAAGHLFAIAVPFAVLALICVLFIKEVPLRTTIDVEDELTLRLEPHDVTSGRAAARREDVPVPGGPR